MKEEKNILVITNMYPSAENKSFGIFVKNQVDALKKRNLMIDVLAITNPKSGKIKVIKKYLIWLLKALLILVTKGRKYQIVHAHYVFPSGYIGLLFKRLYKSRLIVTAHGGDIDKMAKKSKKLFNLTKVILNEADHVIAVGEELQHEIISTYSVNREKVSLINMGVNRQIFRPFDKVKVRNLCGIEKDSSIILFVGNLIKQKGVMELVEALKIARQSHKNVQLYMIGAEKDSIFKEKLERRLVQDHLSSSVRFLGVMDQSKIAVWMSAADLLVLPSHIEGFGLVALEAMACGTPVIGTNVGGLKYLLAEGAGEITPVQNPQELSHSILKVLISKEERESLITNGYKKAEENDQEQMLNRVMEVYFPTGG
jgi:glycosyltransferase involved in cell wall biosynthesis